MLANVLHERVVVKYVQIPLTAMAWPEYRALGAEEETC